MRYSVLSLILGPEGHFFNAILTSTLDDGITKVGFYLETNPLRTHLHILILPSLSCPDYND